MTRKYTVWKDVIWKEKDFKIIHSGTFPNSDLEAIEKKLHEMGFKKQKTGKIKHGRYKIERNPIFSGDI